MTNCFPRLLARLLFLSLCASSAGAASLPEPKPASFEIASVPGWVKSVEAAIPDAVDADNAGISYLLFDQQEQVEPKTSFYHEARQITSENGVQNGAAVSLSFDPSFQKLTFHFIRLRRNGVTTDRLVRSQIKLLQREKEMEMFLYDGSFTAQCELEDIRVGDVIEFAYSIQGDNPVKNGRYSRVFYVDWNVPVRRAVTRIVYPTRRRLNFRNKNRTVTPVVRRVGETTEWSCDETNVRERRTDSDVPADYDPNGWVQITEFNSWQELVEWALPLYQVEVPLSPDLESEISKLRAIPKAEERILAALRFVQEQVRYLGIESGLGSHRPTAPGEVLRRRFGDCKDKALLLSTLLRQSGIEAAPALVSTSLRDRVSERLPAPGDFDHVIVQVKDGASTHWLDATRANQRGPLSQIYVGDFRWALVLQPGTSELCAYTAPRASLPRKEFTENYRVPAPGGVGEIDVVSEYHGLSAETTRADFRENSREKIEKHYLQYYAHRFPRIRVRQRLIYEEIPNENGCRTKEFYSVPDIWTKNDEGYYELGLYPAEVENAMGSAASSQRDDPLALNHPINVTQKINARMFEKWSVNTKDRIENNAFYRYAEKAKVSGSRLEFAFSYETLADRVSPADLQAYNSTLFKIKDTLGYRLTYLQPSEFWRQGNIFAKINWPIVALFGFVITVAMVLAALYVYWSELPMPLLAQPSSVEGIRGWLILVAIYHLAWPINFIRALVGLFPTVFHVDGWQVLTQPGHPEFHPYWAAILLFELLYNALCLVFSFLLLALFFMKRAVWPRCYAFFLVILSLGTGLDVFLAQQIPATRGVLASSIGTLIGTLGAAAIWITYCFRSKRVKATFRF